MDTDWNNGLSHTVRLNTSYPFPNDVVRDGVTNSFTGRISDAVGRWQASMKANELSWVSYIHLWNNPLSGGGTGYAGTQVRYEAVSGSALGTTTWYRGSPTCSTSVHSGTRADLAHSLVRIDVRNDWFTQDDSRRAYWEQCPSRGNTPTFTCSRNVDLGAVVLHELGHALGLRHPQDVDAHDGAAGATSYANCGTYTTAATMCAAIYLNWTAQRTLDAWDNNSIGAHFNHNGYCYTGIPC